MKAKVLSRTINRTIIWHISAAAGAAFIIVALLFADIPYRMQDGTEIDITGKMVCTMR